MNIQRFSNNMSHSGSSSSVHSYGSPSVAVYVAILVTIIFFGSNYVPLRGVKITQNIFFQWIMCHTILLVTAPYIFLTNYSLGFQVYPVVLIGGAIWCCANILCTFAIDRLGLGIATLLWSSMEMSVAWLSGTAGILGVKKQPIAQPELNIFGVIMILLGGILLAQVRIEEQGHILKECSESIKEIEDLEKTSMELTYSSRNNALTVLSHEDEVEERKHSPQISYKALSSTYDAIDTQTKDSIAQSPRRGKTYYEGIILAIASGIMFGVNFNPTQYVIDHSNDRYTSSDLVLSQFVGICLTSTVFYALSLAYSYIALKEYNSIRNMVLSIQKEAIVPGIISGLLWAIAGICWFFAAESLPLSVTFPLITAGPCFISTLWSVFVFKEITNKCDLRILCAALTLLFVGLVSVCISST